jgi:predicted glycosyltransferase
VWVDVDNPPQARYLLPLARRFEADGHSVTITARAYGETLSILDGEGVSYEPIGARFGSGAVRKLRGLVSRTRELTRYIDRQPAPVDLVLTGSRAATVAARRADIPSFVIVDYEYVDLLVFQLSRSNIVYPDVIDDSVFTRRKISTSRLLPFAGLKEDISFAGVDIGAIEPYDFGVADRPLVLFRPPAEESHYFRRESRDVALQLLAHLARQEARVVFSPRFERQLDYLQTVGAWRHEPIVLHEPIPFVSLLKGVSAVVSGGGTMLREAAYLGVPAYSVFRSRIGAVDRHLESIGRLSLLRSADDFAQVTRPRVARLQPIHREFEAVRDITQMILGHVQGLMPRLRVGGLNADAATNEHGTEPLEPNRNVTNG